MRVWSKTLSELTNISFSVLHITKIHKSKVKLMEFCKFVCIFFTFVLTKTLIIAYFGIREVFFYFSIPIISP